MLAKNLFTCCCLVSQRNPNQRLNQGEHYGNNDGAGQAGHPKQRSDVQSGDSAEVGGEDVYFDAQDSDEFEPAPPNTDVNFNQMAEDYFARVDEIHQQVQVEEDAVLDFEDLSGEEDEPDRTPILEEILRESTEPLYPGSQTNRLQFCIVLMSLCTLFSISHHCLDEILTFLKHDVLPVGNTCPTSSYEMKRMLLKLGLSHETIHCCECGKTLYSL
jgi:hypothetical protein